MTVKSKARQNPLSSGINRIVHTPWGRVRVGVLECKNSVFALFVPLVRGALQGESFRMNPHPRPIRRSRVDVIIHPA
jgi:hypothetical protein